MQTHLQQAFVQLKRHRASIGLLIIFIFSLKTPTYSAILLTQLSYKVFLRIFNRFLNKFAVDFPKRMLVKDRIH